MKNELTRPAISGKNFNLWKVFVCTLKAKEKHVRKYWDQDYSYSNVVFRQRRLDPLGPYEASKHKDVLKFGHIENWKRDWKMANSIFLAELNPVASMH